MSYPGDEPELESVCDFLGLADDPESHATYATEAHRCYRLERPTKIAGTHQENFCLGANHRECPVFLGQGVAQTTTTATPPPAEPSYAGSEPSGAVRGPRGPVPGPGIGRPQRPRREPGTLGPRPRSGGISMPAATIGLLGLAIAIVGLAFLVQRILDDGDNGGNTPAGVLGTQQALEETQTAAAGANGDEPTQATGGNGDDPTAPAGNGDDPTQPTGGGNGDDPDPTEPAGGGGETTHIVESGDNCSTIASQYGVTSQDIIDANGLSPACNELQVGEELIIPQ